MRTHTRGYRASAYSCSTRCILVQGCAGGRKLWRRLGGGWEKAAASEELPSRAIIGHGQRAGRNWLGRTGVRALGAWGARSALRLRSPLPAGTAGKLGGVRVTGVWASARRMWIWRAHVSVNSTAVCISLATMHSRRPDSDRAEPEPWLVSRVSGLHCAWSARVCGLCLSNILNLSFVVL